MLWGVNSQQVQIQWEVDMQNKVLYDVHTQATPYLIIDKNELHHQATVVAEEAHSKSLREVEERLKALGEY